MRNYQEYRKLGVKMTPQRIAILNKLEGNTSHPTAEDIYNSLVDAMPTISLATVYNTLQLFHEKGLLIQLNIDPERKHYDPNLEAHHHIICTNCKKIFDIFENIEVDMGNESLAGFTILANEISFYGICPDCKSGN